MHRKVKYLAQGHTIWQSWDVNLDSLASKFVLLDPFSERFEERYEILWNTGCGGIGSGQTIGFWDKVD